MAVALGAEPVAPSTFEADLRAALQRLREDGRLAFVVTMPDLVSLAEAARLVVPTAPDWAAFYAIPQECAADPQYPARNQAMNDLIQRVAAEEGALHDGGALAGMRWTPAMVSTADAFHPSPAGQQAMADAAWAGYRAALAVEPS